MTDSADCSSNGAMRIGIPNLQMFNPRRGIGRTVTTLAAAWERHGHTVVSVPSRRVHGPIVRNVRLGLFLPAEPLDVLWFGDLAGAEALLFTRGAPPSAVLVHDLGALDCALDQAGSTYLTRLVMRLSLLAAARAERVITVSEFTLGRLRAVAPGAARRAQAVLSGLDHGVFFPRDRSACRDRLRSLGVQLGDADFVLLYVGAEYPRKNLRGLIAGFSLLLASVPNARLLKVGAAHSARDRQATLAEVARHGLTVGRQVCFVDEVDDEELANLYCAADVFVSASKYEGFGLPMLEAMACGVPAVVSRAGAFPEVGGDAALYFDPDSPAELAQRLAMLAHADRRPWAAAAQRRAARFDWDVTAQNILQVLQAVSGAPVLERSEQPTSSLEMPRPRRSMR